MKKTIKIVLNVDYGGFSLSKKAILRMRELGSDWAKRVLLKGEKHPWQNYIHEYDYNDYSFAASETDYWEEAERTCPILVQVVEELGKEANGKCANLEVKEVTYELGVENQYDGIERIFVNVDKGY